MFSVHGVETVSAAHDGRCIAFPVLHALLDLSGPLSGRSKVNHLSSARGLRNELLPVVLLR